MKKTAEKPTESKPVRKARPKLEKKVKGFGHYVEKAEKRKNDGLAACVAVWAKPTDKGLRTVQKAFSSFLGLRFFIEERWNDDGTDKPTVEPSELAKAWYGLSIVLDRKSGKFRGTLFRYPAEQAGERVVIASTEKQVTKSAAEKLLMAAAEQMGVKNRVKRRFPKYFEGDLDLEKERAKVAAAREQSIEAVKELVMVGRTASTDCQLDMIVELNTKLQRWITKNTEFSMRWDADGKWIGPKRKQKVAAELLRCSDVTPETGDETQP